MYEFDNSKLAEEAIAFAKVDKYYESLQVVRSIEDKQLQLSFLKKLEPIILEQIVVSSNKTYWREFNYIKEIARFYLQLGELEEAIIILNKIRKRDIEAEILAELWRDRVYSFTVEVAHNIQNIGLDKRLNLYYDGSYYDKFSLEAPKGHLPQFWAHQFMQESSCSCSMIATRGIMNSFGIWWLRSTKPNDAVNFFEVIDFCDSNC